MKNAIACQPGRAYGQNVTVRFYLRPATVIEISWSGHKTVITLR
jgi:hypothetical protein